MTNLAIDTRLLEEAYEIGETKSEQDTVNVALQEFIEKRKVRSAQIIQWHKSTAKNPRLLCEPDSTKPSLLGCMDGLVKIPVDFDDTLEEMKEYMY